MPIYSMKDTNTDEIFEVELKMSERESFLEQNPNIKQIFTRFPGIVDSVRIGVHKTPDSFKDVLRKVKTSFRGSTVDV